jgi:hypothetical protein
VLRYCLSHFSGFLGFPTASTLRVTGCPKLNSEAAQLWAVRVYAIVIRNIIQHTDPTLLDNKFFHSRQEKVEKDVEY